MVPAYVDSGNNNWTMFNEFITETGSTSTGSSGVDFAGLDLNKGRTDEYCLTHMDNCIVKNYHLLFSTRGFEQY